MHVMWMTLLVLTCLVTVTVGQDDYDCDIGCTGCSCTRAAENSYKLTVECINYNLSSVPDCLMENVTSLYILGSNITQLHVDDFINATKLELLTITNSYELADIENGTFSKLSSLQTLHLSGLGDVTLHEGLFLGLDSLIDLTIINTEISGIQKDTLLGLGSLTILDLSSNKLSDITEESFFDVVNLVSLDLSGNQLMSINDQTLVGPTMLMKLDLSSNQLVSLTSESLGYLINLSELDLSYNQLGDLQDDLFTKLGSLEEVNLSYNNFGQVPAGTLSKVELSLRKLNLNGNQIEQVIAEDFGTLSALENLYMDNAGIFAIQEDGLKGLGNLQVLQITNNRQLEKLDLGAISADFLPNLQELYLYNNSLSSFQKEILYELPSLEKAEVYGNPYFCDCAVAWMREIMDDDSIPWSKDWLEGDTGPVCFTPPTFQGLAIKDVDVTDLTCEQALVDGYESDYYHENGYTNVWVMVVLSRGIPTTAWFAPGGKVVTPVYPDLPPSGTDKKIASEERLPTNQVKAYLNVSMATEASVGYYILQATNAGGAVNLTNFELNLKPAPKGLGPGEIVAIVVAGVVLVLIVVLLGVGIGYFRKRRAYQHMEEEGPGYANVTPGESRSTEDRGDEPFAAGTGQYGSTGPLHVNTPHTASHTDDPATA